MPKKIVTGKNKVLNKKENIQEKSKKTEETQEISPEKKKKRTEKAVITFLIILGAIVVLLVVTYLIFFSMKYSKYTYNGVDFTSVQEGKLMFYKFSIPVYYQGKEIPYNFYIRTNPRILKNVVFENLQNYQLMRKIVIVAKSNFTNCDGDQVIAMANLVKLYTFIGANVSVQYGNSTLCDLSGKTMYLNLEESNETKIFQVGFSCFQVDVNNCEILKATEKLMVESVVKYNAL
jgi:ABC-type sugar transport system permease subunit